MEVEDAALAVGGRAQADAPVELLPRVVLAGDVASLDAAHRRAVRRRRRRGPGHLAEHHEPGEEEDDEGERQLLG